MIDRNNVLSEMACAAWIDGTDATELARAAEFAVAHEMRTIAVPGDAVRVIWPWIEGRDIAIMARIVAPRGTSAASELARLVRDAMMHGADGAIIMINPRSLGAFADDMRMVRDDLFFNKKMTIALDLNNVDGDAWHGIFENMGRVRADGLMATGWGADTDTSDFVGRLYGLMDAWDVDTFDGNLDFAFGDNMTRAVQASRLVQKMRPHLATRSEFFIPV